MQNGESKWTVIANGKSIENGTTIRKNGIVSHFVTSQVDSGNKKQIKQQAEKNDAASEDNDEDVEIEEAMPDAESSKEERKCPSLKVNTFCTKASNEALATVIQQLRWRESKGNFKSSPTADMYWHGPGFEEALYNKTGVYAVNKLPGMVELSQKVHLSRIIKRMQLLFPGEFDFYPPTWFLPEQYHQFVAEVSLKNNRKSISVPTVGQFGQQSTPDQRSNRDPQHTYIVKPDCGSQGDGIYLVNDPRDVQEAIGSKPAIVQKYIDDPLLLDNFKFDLRIYVAVARLNPIEIYLCKDGLARLCTVEYESPRPSNLHNTFMHLTNYSINKFSDDFQQTNAENTGSKRTYRGVRQILRKQGYDVNKIHQQIIDLVVKTVLSLIPDIMIWDHVTNKSKLVRSFQILGFDILVTSDLRAHLLEVNSSPSMGIEANQETEPGSGITESVTSAVDEQIKVPLLRDVLRLIAYGESDINLNKSCLQRVYPPCPKSPNQSTPRHDSLKTDKARDHQVQKQHSKVNVRASTDHGQFRFRQNLPSQKRDSHPASEEIYNKIKVKDLQEPEIQMVEHHGVNGRNRFDNPLLRSETTHRQHFSLNKPKRFTVVKYRQEYAISTEEWRLFQLRSRISATSATGRVDIHPVRPCHPRPNSRNRSVVPSVVLETPQSRNASAHDLSSNVCCRICGHFIHGVGPGLFQSQQMHKTQVEQNEAKLESEKAVFQPYSPTLANSRRDELECSVETPSGRYRSHDWESESKDLHPNPLPPRSIYFSSAQFEEEEELCLSQKCNVPPPTSHQFQEDSKVQQHICDNCMETSTSSSTEESAAPSRHKPLSSRDLSRKSEPLTRQSTEKPEKSHKFAMKDVMLVKRAAAVFIFFNGFKPSLRIGATAFRNMARKCRLCDQGAMPAIDILFIDTMRQWQRQVVDHKSPFYDSKNQTLQHPIGLPFQGFLEALFRIAKARFKGQTLREKLESLVSSCEEFMKEANRAKKIARKKRDFQVKQKTSMSPRVSCGLSQRQPYY